MAKTKIQEIKTPTDRDFVGMELEAAKKLAATREVKVRVTSIDGRRSIVTMDHRLDRVNFTVLDGKVITSRRG